MTEPRELPMFPLGMVLVPSMALPLHIFEERYRVLAADVLAGDSTFGVVLIERGSEVGGGDQRAQVGCAAQIIDHVTFDDGRLALATVGVQRFRIVEWLEETPYPRAMVIDLPDEGAGEHDWSLQVAQVAAKVRRALAKAAELGDDVHAATFELAEDSTLASYQLSALAPIGTMDRQQLLEASGPADRLVALQGCVDDALEVLDARLSGA